MYGSLQKTMEKKCLQMSPLSSDVGPDGKVTSHWINNIISYSFKRMKK